MMKRLVRQIHEYGFRGAYESMVALGIIAFAVTYYPQTRKVTTLQERFDQYADNDGNERITPHELEAVHEALGFKTERNHYDPRVTVIHSLSKKDMEAYISPKRIAN